MSAERSPTDPPPAADLDTAATVPPPTPSTRLTPTASGAGTAAGSTAPSGGTWVAESAPPAIQGYELLAELGRGGMGVVYKARHLRLGRLVALKMILAGGHAGDQALARFRTEAEAIARLQHPGVVQIYEIGEHDGLPFFAMEYCPDGSLDRKLAGAPLPPREAAALAEMLARAMHAAHQAGVVHRDLKPANVLLVRADAGQGVALGKAGAGADCYLPKVTDFGLAKKLDEAGQTQTGAVMGTPSYMAPEQAAGRVHEIGPAADVYALGAVLYEFLTGRPPFRAATALDTLFQVVQAEPVSPRLLQPAVPRDLETVCLHCLEKGPGRRYPTALALAEDLRRFLDDQPITARPASTLYQVRKFTQRHRVLVGGAAAVFLALLLGIVGTGIGLARARAERDHAVNARLAAEAAEARERDLRRLSYVDAAHLAGRRGAWRAALDDIQSALDVGGAADTPDLRLEQVRAWAALHDLPRAEAALNELARRPDLGPLEGQALLWQADLALNRSPQDAGALEKVRRALDRGLPPAETAYARGLLAPTSPEALRQFEQAVREDPFHQRANGMLALLLVCLGRRPEARERTRVGELLFPDDPTFRLVHALLDALDGDVPRAQSDLDAMRPQLGPKQMASARALVDVATQLPRLMDVMGGAADTSAGMRFALTIWPSVAKLQAALAEPGGDLYLPLPPVLMREFAGFPSLANLSLMLATNPDRVLTALDRAVAIHPDAILYLGQALLLSQKERYGEAEQAALRAADAPSLIPVRPRALFVAVGCGWLQLGPGRGPQPEVRRRVADNLGRLLALGDVTAEEGLPLSQIALNVNRPDLARRVLEQWEQRAPKDTKLLEQRARLAFATGAWASAFDLSDQVLRRTLADKDRQQWSGLRAQALGHLRGQMDAAEKRQPGK